MFKFKTPSEKTRQTMSKVALGKTNINFEERCTEKIKRLTEKEEVKITSSGNNSIFIALSAIKGDIIIPDQGGWHGFKQIAKFLNKNIITLKTDLGLINPKYIDELDLREGSALIYTSFAGYCAEQDTKSIAKYCKNNNILTIEDASAGIGDSEKKLGKYSDIILASTGSPKIINVGQGGFIASNESEIFKEDLMPQKLSKTSEIVCSGIDSELDNIAEKLNLTVNATNYLKKYINNALHPNKRGVNVIILHDDAKAIGWNLKKKLTTDKSGFITTCPNYNRVKQKAISIEIKNLDYNCLKKEHLDKIIEEMEINNLQ
ncbi:DegT/DnrJ/EryC1/StrS aminotransferase family protein [Methanobrevibacter gottschalkii DSM 11977]|uniref:DegT/DnrJ/EryC1/StrS aminotransferase family protein n=1 Tax=Methanobrevibacter gottschalkii DSM 11977 TaxID=1122229 RepID=A0A3N5C396_9EURY|nr:DegT/DnrJ/EryC1/StrS family aminotransferase [Methanobrevibacter gottschalkii]RPF50721.1 DegT/DnrJ/EryC1/StrS aminotransferase family protein [Methanobrevibacter gottschalkii DSM 11977]